MVPKYQVDDFEFVVQRRARLRAYLESMKDEDSTSQELIQEITTVLSDLIKFCTISDNDSPLEREGTPIPTHQKLLSKPHVRSLEMKFRISVSYPLRISTGVRRYC